MQSGGIRPTPLPPSRAGQPDPGVLRYLRGRKVAVPNKIQLEMKIAQIAPLYESVPPKLYGGTERVVSYLTEALVELGHEVTLYASGDSITSATLRPMSKGALRLDPRSIDPVADHVKMMEQVHRAHEDFDVVHSHIDYIGFPYLRRMRTANLTTLHGRLDISNLQPLYDEFVDIPVISISDAQRGPLPKARWRATVYHGLPERLYRLNEAQGAYLAFLGRISPEKRVDTAIHIARRVGMPLKIAAKVDKADTLYFERTIRPLIDGRNVEFIGEIGEKDKGDFLGNALALLFPIEWPEPFGLVMIEAMACGTPVIAFPNGAVPEVMQPGVTGFVVKDVENAAKAVEKVRQLDRKRCREVFETNFTATRMAENYLAAYTRELEETSTSGLPTDTWRT
jgi:glycosyltransferase involved in cell wall biosynthesis